MTAVPPEITVLDGALVIVDGQTAPIDLGSAVHNAAGASKTFTIRNDGDENLDLTTPFADTAHFTVGDPGATTLTAGQTTTFLVTLNTGVIWTGSEEVSFVNGDGDESPFTFVVSGTVTAQSNKMSTIGLYNPMASAFYLRNTNDAGYANLTFAYGPANGGWKPVAGDWIMDGTCTIGLYAPATSRFYLRNTNDAGYANVTFAYGPVNVGWLSIAGDWDGDGTDTIGLYNPISSVFYLRNTNSGGYADLTFAYGPPNAGWLPIASDWNGDGTDTIGLYNPTTSVFYLRNTNNAGYADLSFAYGPANASWMPVAGDWDTDGTDTIGLYDPTMSRFYLRNSNDAGYADATFAYGPTGSGWLPIVGDWMGDSALRAAEAPLAASSNVPALSQADLQPIVSEALVRWTNAGLDTVTVAKLAQVQFVIRDLPGDYLGEAQANQIYLDRNAADHGWFVDPTPALDEEFFWSVSDRRLQAIDPRAVDQIDLLTVVEHELGHIVRFDDLDALADNLMSGMLGTGVRRNPFLDHV